jgi:hypothetical protein
MFAVHGNRELNLKVLADNMRSSLEMLDKHYLSQTSNEAFVEEIQKRNRK